jgi:hypothetical protein
LLLLLSLFVAAAARMAQADTHSYSVSIHDKEIYPALGIKPFAGPVPLTRPGAQVSK